jgi:hypothetical protein
MICDSDHILPQDYVEIIINRMEQNPKVVVASGRIKGEPYVEIHPRGTGRIVNANFWRKVNGLKYPEEWGWETWICLKAMQLGNEVICFYDVVSTVIRPTQLGKAELWGKAMYALGYDWKYALGRCFLTFLKSPTAGWNMLIGWLSHKNVKRLEIAKWVSQMQKERFFKRLWYVIKKFGRK